MSGFNSMTSYGSCKPDRHDEEMDQVLREESDLIASILGDQEVRSLSSLREGAWRDSGGEAGALKEAGLWSGSRLSAKEGGRQGERPSETLRSLPTVPLMPTALPQQA